MQKKIGLCALAIGCFLLLITIDSTEKTNQPTNNTAPAVEKPIDFDKSIYEGLKTFAELFSLVKHSYYQEVDPEKAMHNALVAFTKTLDPHSTFLDKKAYHSMKELIKGELCGIGVIIDNTKQEDDEFIVIVDTIPAGPADKAGLKSEDKILEIDGQSVRGMNLEEAISKIKGKKNTQVTLRIQRNDTARHLHFTITRDTVSEQNALCYYFSDQQIYYIGLNMFTENSVKQIEELLKKIEQEKSRGLILDLRYNTGGLLPAVIDISGIFLPKGSLVVTTKGRDKKEIERYETRRDPIITNNNLPICILVNNFTASAAEILAGCLQHYAKLHNKPIFIVGTVTFGKGSVQRVDPIGTDNAVKLTIALYYLPNDVSIQGIGIEPDFIIEPKISPSQETAWFNKMFGKESSYKNSIQEKRTKNSKKTTPEKVEKKEQEKSWYEKKRDLISSDYVVLSALRLVCMTHLAQKNSQLKFKNHAELIQWLKNCYVPEDKAEIVEIPLKEK